MIFDIFEVRHGLNGRGPCRGKLIDQVVCDNSVAQLKQWAKKTGMTAKTSTLTIQHEQVSNQVVVVDQHHTPVLFASLTK